MGIEDKIVRMIYVLFINEILKALIYNKINHFLLNKIINICYFIDKCVIVNI